jgi:uncharacterized membrane protein YadS
MVRNVFMAFVIPLVALYYNRRNQDNSAQETSIVKLIPLFIIGFLLMAAVRSIGDSGINSGGNAFGLWSADQWHALTDSIKHWATNLMVIALAGVGLKTSFSIIKGLGVRPFLVGLFAALTVGVVSVISISLLTLLVTL